jgi:hypothetical protein
MIGVFFNVVVTEHTIVVVPKAAFIEMVMGDEQGILQRFLSKGLLNNRLLDFSAARCLYDRDC